MTHHSPRRRPSAGALPVQLVRVAMEQFLVNDPVEGRQNCYKQPRPPKPRSQANLLFNPRPRQHPDVPGAKSKDHQHGGWTASSYEKVRTSKLSEQAPTAVSQIFAGLSFYFNGRSADKQTLHLKGAVSKYGGRTTPFMSVKGVTHVIAENLSGTKTDKAMKSLKTKVVHPDWLLRCMTEGRLLPDAPFRVVRSQKLGMNHFLPSHDAENVEKREKHRTVQPSMSSSRGSGASKSAREPVSGTAATATPAATIVDLTTSPTGNRGVGKGNTRDVKRGSREHNGNEHISTRSSTTKTSAVINKRRIGHESYCHGAVAGGGIGAEGNSRIRSGDGHHNTKGAPSYRRGTSGSALKLRDGSGAVVGVGAGVSPICRPFRNKRPRENSTPLQPVSSVLHVDECRTGKREFVTGIGAVAPPRTQKNRSLQLSKVGVDGGGFRRVR